MFMSLLLLVLLSAIGSVPPTHSSPPSLIKCAHCKIHTSFDAGPLKRCFKKVSKVKDCPRCSASIVFRRDEHKATLDRGCAGEDDPSGKWSEAYRGGYMVMVRMVSSEEMSNCGTGRDLFDPSNLGQGSDRRVYEEFVKGWNKSACPALRSP